MNKNKYIWSDLKCLCMCNPYTAPARISNRKKLLDIPKLLKWKTLKDEILKISNSVLSKSMFENVKFTLLMMDTKYRQADYSYLQFCIFIF